MRKSKYGEETVAIRVPKSRKQDVLTFLKQFEVIDSMEKDLNDLKKSPEVQAYERGYMEGFKKGEMIQYLMGVSFVGTDKDAQMALDIWEKRVPDSLHVEGLERLSKVMLNSDFDVSKRLFSLANQISDDAKKITSPAKELLPGFNT